MFSREGEYRSRVESSLRAAKRVEETRRLDVLSPANPVFQKLLGRNIELAENLKNVPTDWQVMFRSYGVSFLRDYPYDTPLYGIIGWDACRLVVDLDLDQNAVALRFHAYDEEADMKVKEGMLVIGGNMATMNEGRFDIPWTPFRSEMIARIEKATGSTKDPETLRCLFDYFADDIGVLPGVKESCGKTFGQFATSAYLEFQHGTMGVLKRSLLLLDWPMIGNHYLRGA